MLDKILQFFGLMRVRRVQRDVTILLEELLHQQHEANVALKEENELLSKACKNYRVQIAELSK